MTRPADLLEQLARVISRRRVHGANEGAPPHYSALDLAIARDVLLLVEPLMPVEPETKDERERRFVRAGLCWCGCEPGYCPH